MKLRWKLIAASLSLFALTAQARVEDRIDVEAIRMHELQVQLQPEQYFVSATENIHVLVTFANNGQSAVSLTKWFVPGEDFDEPLFDVTLNGMPVDYMGPLVKRMAPTADDLITLQPGEQMTIPVELSGTYDFSAGGEYAISYRTRSAHLFGPDQRQVELLASPAIAISVEGRAYSSVHAPGDGLKKKPGGGGGGGGPGITFTGSCSASQQDLLTQAVSAARTMAGGANSYLGRGPRATERYTTWFGTFSAGGWNTAGAHFVAIDDAFNNKPLTLDCSCKKNYYAYVYPTQEYKIYVCNAFWSAPMTGTDSKGGTLIHEMSHFDVVAGTEDWAYGQSAAKSLAISDPAKALDNADSHEYFAENTPALP